MHTRCSEQLKHALGVCAQLEPGAPATLKFFQEDPFPSACQVGEVEPSLAVIEMDSVWCILIYIKN